MKRLVLVSAMALTASPAAAAEYLTEVASQVYQTAGTPKEIATRANICIAQNLRAGNVSAPQIVSSDLENGVIVAQNALQYGSLPVWKIRSRLTFEAREGRFRITQTGLERFNDLYGGSWDPIGKWWGSGWKKAEEAFVTSASAVAACVMAGPQKRDDW